MYRIRFHGRGGQGVKTASRILGSALFLEGFEVQDAPRFGAERRGAPVFAYVRASRRPILERGIIQAPDLVVVADDTLLPVPAAGVLAGLSARSVLLLLSAEPAELWRERLALEATVLTLPAAAGEPGELRFLGAACAGAAACLLGVVSPESLERALSSELAELGEGAIASSQERARAAWDRLAAQRGCVAEGEERTPIGEGNPAWIELHAEAADVAAPHIHAAATSLQVPTGLWRTLRPLIEEARCNRCWWICSTLCPESAIEVGEDRRPHIDYEHCKGCLICVAVCPAHAIRAEPERGKAAQGAR